MLNIILMLSDINYITFRKNMFLMKTVKCSIDLKCTAVDMFAFYFLICHFQIHLHCVPLPFAKTPFIIKVEPVHNVAGRHQESVFTLQVPGNEFPHTSLICLISL